MVAVRESTGLTDDLNGLCASLEALDLRTARLRGKNSEAARDQLVRTIRLYLVPRLLDPEIPLSVVFAGPTGSGKSTLLNSIAGLEVAETGPIRPTTTEPIVLTSRKHRHRFATLGGVDCDLAVGSAPILGTMALVDTPDIDSTSTHHRRVAELLIDHADVVVFVTSTLRYADLAPWEVLRRAVSRGAPVLHVLNRYASSSSGALVDFQARLRAEGLPVDVIRVPEHHVIAGGHAVPSLAVRELARRLVEFARDQAGYQQGVMNRVLDSTLAQAGELATSVEEDRRWLEERIEDVRSRFAAGPRALDLAAVASPVEFDFPERRSPRRLRRWARRTEVRVDIAAQVACEVDTHIRSMGVADNDVSSMVEETLPGWFEFARRVAEEQTHEHLRLRGAALIWASLGGDDPEMMTYLFGPDHGLFVDRVERDLLSRLHVVYSHAAERLVERFLLETGDPESALVTERVSAVVARSHFADA